MGPHSPDGLQAALDGLGGDEAGSGVVDLVWQAEAHLQPAVDVQPYDARCAQAADSGHRYRQGPSPFTRSPVPTHTGCTKPRPRVLLPSTPPLRVRGQCKWRPPGQESIFPDLSALKRRKWVRNTHTHTNLFLASPGLYSPECEGSREASSMSVPEARHTGEA